MRTIALGSIFRNSTRYLPRYFDQLERTDHVLTSAGYHLRPILVEGDSTDDTYWQLANYLPRRFPLRHILVCRNHGGPAFGSVDDPQRWHQLSYASNGVCDNLTADIDALIYVESDLLWAPETILALLTHLERIPEITAVAPMCFVARDNRLDTPPGNFYDTWGFRRNGVNFSPTPPYHPCLAERHDNASGLARVDSVGSCIAVRGDIAIHPDVRFQPEDCFVGYCRTIYAAGGSIYVDPDLEVRHPV